MKSKAVVLVFGVLFLLSSPASALDFLYPAEVEWVIDGDTIVVDLCLGLDIILDNQYIRFYGIDAWETRGEERSKGLLAKRYVMERLEGKEGLIEIEIRPEWGSGGRGKYGRWLGIIWVDGKNLNHELFEKGHAECVEY